MPVPWPAPARDALVSLLGAGRSAVPVWESLDQAGVITALIPYWDVVRSAPQHNPVHRYTVDRHLLEAAVQACAFTRDVHRPDLLLVGALLHDIGKGRPGQDHTDVGVGLVAEIAEHLGFGAEDSRVLVEMCRHHLLLPETATRRDLDDPQTIDTVVQAVGTAEMLELLAALTKADALATGPLAWTSWKQSLVTELVDRVRGQLAGEELPVEPRLSEDQMAMASGEGVRVLLQENESGFDITVGRAGLAGPAGPGRRDPVDAPARGPLRGDHGRGRPGDRGVGRQPAVRRPARGGPPAGGHPPRHPRAVRRRRPARPPRRGRPTHRRARQRRPLGWRSWPGPRAGPP